MLICSYQIQMKQIKKLGPLENLIKQLDAFFGFTDENGEKITITDKLKQEIEDRIAADQQLREDLDKEIAARIEDVEKLIHSCGFYRAKANPYTTHLTNLWWNCSTRLHTCGRV